MLEPIKKGGRVNARPKFVSAKNSLRYGFIDPAACWIAAFTAERNSDSDVNLLVS
jgi:hypothetical protein